MGFAYKINVFSKNIMSKCAHKEYKIFYLQNMHLDLKTIIN
jgi:hypothetical protein